MEWGGIINVKPSSCETRPTQDRIFSGKQMTYTLQVVEQQRYPWLHGEYGGVFINVSLQFSPIIRVLSEAIPEKPEFC